MHVVQVCRRVASSLMPSSFALFLTLLALGSTLPAQTGPNFDEGLKAFGSFQGGNLDTVSMTNGNVTVHIPIASYPQRGGRLDEQYFIRMNSKGWQTVTKVNLNGTTGKRWSTPSGRGVGPNVALVNNHSIILHRTHFEQWNSCQGLVLTSADDYQVETPDGSMHRAMVVSHGDPSSIFRSIDASGFRVEATETPIFSADIPVVYDRNGLRYSFGSWGGTRTQQGPDAGDCAVTEYNYNDIAGVSSVEDANGNIISNSATTAGDTLGRQAPVTPQSPVDMTGCGRSDITNTNLVTFPGPTGTSPVKLCYATLPLSTTFGQASTEEYSPAMVPAPPPFIPMVAAVLPNGTSWTFSYDNFGNITEIKLPTGGTITYTWVTQPSCSSDGGMTTMSRYVTSRTVDANDGTGPQQWTYSWGDSSGGLTVTNSVKDPVGNVTTYTASNLASNMAGCSYYETSRTINQLLNGTLVPQQTISTQYSNTLINTNDSWIASNVVPSQVTTTYPSGKTSLVVNSYDCSPGFPCEDQSTPFTTGSLMQKDEYDFGSSTSGPFPFLRSTVTHYAWEADANYLTYNLIDLPVSTDVFDSPPPVDVRPQQASCESVGSVAGPLPKQETCFHYDQYNPTSPKSDPSNPLTASNVTKQHSTPINGYYRGNQTSIDHWLNLPAEKTITTKASFADTGVVLTSIDALGHHTGLDYSPTFYGAYVTTLTDPAGLVTTKDYDFNTGLIKSITDLNLNKTSFQYDSSFRLTTKTLAPTAQGTGVAIFHYRDAAPFGVDLTSSITPSLNLQGAADVDGVGRERVTRLTSDPDGMVYTRVLYDGLGRKQKDWNASRCDLDANPTSCTGETTFGFTQYVYDGLGRTTMLIPQDGTAQVNNVQTDYSAFPIVTVTDEQGRLRRSRSDALGRLVEVDEPTPISGGTTPTAAFVISTGPDAMVGNAPQVATSGSGWITFGTNLTADRSTPVTQCDDAVPKPHCLTTTQYDTGNITVTITGTTPRTVTYGRGSTPSSIATALQNAFAGDSLVNVQVITNGISIAARATGRNSNYTFTASSVTTDTDYFTGTSFPLTVSGATLVNGQDAVPDTRQWDSGTVQVQVGTFVATANYGQNSTGTTIATDLINRFNTDPNSPAKATASNGGFTLTSYVDAPDGNYPIVAQSTSSQPVTFSTPSFTVSAPPSMSGQVGASLTTPAVTLYTYDVLGNLTRVDQCGTAPLGDPTCRVRTFTYDSLSRLLSATNPEVTAHDPGTPTLDHPGTINYVYDDDGNVVNKISPASNDHTGSATITVTYTYDADNRLTIKSYSRTNNYVPKDPAVQYSYDEASHNGLAITNGKGHRTSMCANYNVSTQTCDPANQAAWSFDELGRVLTERRTISGITKTISYGYNLDGSIASITYPSGRTVTYTPGGAGRPLSAIDNSNSIKYAQNAHYSPAGALTSVLEGAASSFTGFSVSNTFNSRLQPSRMQATQGSTPVFDLSYNYNWGSANNGNIIQILNNRDANRTATYTYDELNRISTADTASAWGYSFTEDAWGNLLQMNVTKGSAPPLLEAVTAKNQFSDGCYDAAGNMTNQGNCGATAYSYDGENRVSSAGGVTYSYDADGQRTSKSSGTLYWRGITADTLTETDAAGNVTSEYVFFNGNRVARWDSTGVHYYFSDHLGSTSIVASAASSPISEQESDYYPFGGERVVIAGPNHYKFTGKERDTETGLDYFGARYFASNMGRWMSPDWSAQVEPVPYAKLDNPQSLNLYSYVLNNPLSLKDEDGHNQDTPEQKAAKNVDNAKTSAGTDRYDINNTVVSNSQVFKSGSDKCNLYVSETVKNSTGEHTTVEGTGKIPSAAQFADPNVKITGLSAPEPMANAKPGDVIAQDHGANPKSGNEEGHVGIIVSLPHDGQPGQTASANANQGGRVTINDWGFRSPTANPNNGERHGADSPPPVVRHPL